MQRYHVYPQDYYIVDDGDFVLHSDAQSALLAKDGEIAQLRSLLEQANNWLGPDHPYWDAKFPGTLEHLHERIRQALSRDKVKP